MYDLVIVGSGPAGLAAALRAEHHGLNYLVVERGAIANTVYRYPIGMVLFSTSNEVGIERDSLPTQTKPTREELLRHYRSLVMRYKLAVRTGEDVHRLARDSEGFLVCTSNRRYRARVVIAAIGGFGRKRTLNVPGEDVSRVSYRFVEAHPYALKRVLVIGGGNSAAEVALFLLEAGADVTLAIRRAELNPRVRTGEVGSENRLVTRIKAWVCEPLEMAASQGKIQIISSSEILEVGPTTARLRTTNNGVTNTFEVECDHIFALIGANPDTRLLESVGTEMADDGRPIYSDETFETTVPGLFVAGHVTRQVHIKNAIAVARKVVDHIAFNVLEERMACGAYARALVI